jgi:hypothetical protein
MRLYKKKGERGYNAGSWTQRVSVHCQVLVSHYTDEVFRYAFLTEVMATLYFFIYPECLPKTLHACLLKLGKIEILKNMSLVRVLVKIIPLPLKQP